MALKGEVEILTVVFILISLLIFTCLRCANNTPNAGEKFSLNKQTNKTNKQTCLYNLIGSDLRMAGSLLPFWPAPAGQPSETVAGAQLRSSHHKVNTKLFDQ